MCGQYRHGLCLRHARTHANDIKCGLRGSGKNTYAGYCASNETHGAQAVKEMGGLMNRVFMG